jgi:cysteine desulfurase/selenocysteine lyase
MLEVYERYYGNVHRATHRLARETTVCYEAAREKVRSLINAAQTAEIIFTSGTTHAINLVARGWGDPHVGRGDEILLSEMEHHSNLLPWQQLAERKHAVLRFIPVTADGRLDMSSLERLLSPRTRMVAIAAASNVLGTINPVAEIVRQAHRVGAVVLVDAAQAVPHMPVDVRELDVDFLAFGGHKMLGPTGIGVLYGCRPLLERMEPVWSGGSMMLRASLDGFEPAGLPARFEAGTPAIVQAIGLGAAVDYLQAMGLEAIAEHEHRLTVRGHDRLSRIPRVRLWGPSAEWKVGILAFTVDGIDSHTVADFLDRREICVRAGHHCTMPLHERLGTTSTVRASFYVYNTPADVDRLADALEEMIPEGVNG